MKYSKRSLGVGSGAVLFALWVPACGGTTTTTGTGTDPGAGTSTGSAAPISIAQLGDQLANAFCDNIGGCCQAAGIAFDLAECKANILSVVSQGLAREMSPNIRYDANAAGACVAAYASVVKSCKSSNSIETACTGVFVGSLPAGAPCTVDDECASPAGSAAFCDGGDSTNGGASGTCSVTSASATSAHGKLGESCAASCPSGTTCAATGPSAAGGSGTGPPITSVCYSDDGLYCSANATCQPLIAVGQPCSFDGCVNGAFCGAGVCTAGKADGAACTFDTECAGGSCLSSGAPSTGTGTGVTGTCSGRGIANTRSCAGDLG